MVTGLSGTGLVLQDSGGDTLPISGNGAFTFSRKLASGNVFYVAVTSQPTNPAQSCEVAGGIGVVSAASTDSVSVTCSAKTSSTDSLGGVVTGLQGSGLVLQDGRGDTLPISANGPFVFPASLLAGTTYTVSVRTPPISPYQDCSVTNSNGTAGATDITGVVVSCQLNSNATEPVSVTVAGLSGAGTTLLLQNNGRDPISVQSDGTYTFATRVPANSPYSVTATVPGTTQSITCTIDAASGVVQPGSPVTVAAQCQKNAFATVQITTSGLAAPSASFGATPSTTLLIRDSIGDPPFSIATNGTATFPSFIMAGQPYQLSIAAQPTAPWQSCTLTPSSGVAGTQTGALISASVTCTTNTYTVSGVVSGLPSPLTGGPLQLLDNGGDALPLTSNGAFSFPTSLASGTSFTVTVGAEPGNSTSVYPGYPQTDVACLVTSGSGVIYGGPANGVTVRCVQPIGFLYVTNSADNTLSTYMVDASGTLIPSGGPVASGTHPVSVVGTTVFQGQASPISVLYSANAGSNDLSLFTVDQETGVLTLGGPILLGLQQPTTLLTDASGRYLYIGNAGTPQSYVTELTLSNPMHPAPLSPGTVSIGGGVVAATQDCARFYFVNAIDATVSALTEDLTTNIGTLSPVTDPATGHPIPFTTGTGPTSIASYINYDANLNQVYYLYIVNSSAATISEYQANCSSSGGLTALGTLTPFLSGLKAAVTVGSYSSDTPFLYTSTASGIVGFNIGVGGALGSQLGPPVPAGASPGSMATAQSATSDLATIVTQSTQVTLTATDPALLPGMAVSGTGIQPGTAITAISGATLTLSQPATLSLTGTYLSFAETYLYVANTGDNTVSAFRVDYRTGQLASLGPPVACGASPSAIFFMRRPNLRPG